MEITEMPTEEEKAITRQRMLQVYGETLKRRRKERGITQTELSERTGISRAVIVDVEQGLAELTAAQRLRIKKFLRRQKII